MLPNFSRVPVPIPLPLEALPALLRQLQDALQEGLRRIIQSPILDGRYVTSVPLAAGAPTTIATGLGRAVAGWWLCDITAAATVYRLPSSVDGQLVLQASAACTVNVWVF